MPVAAPDDLSQVIAQLKVVEKDVISKNNGALIETVRLAVQLCSILELIYNEEAEKRRAFINTVARKDKLQAQLNSLIHSINQADGEQQTAVYTPSNAATPVTTEAQTTGNPNGPALLYRLKEWLSNAASPQGDRIEPGCETTDTPANAPTPTTAPAKETPATDMSQYPLKFKKIPAKKSRLHRRNQPADSLENHIDTATSTPSMIVTCLGSFSVYQDGMLIKNWYSSKGKAIFKYLVIKHHQPVPKELLMEQFWPETAAEAARNNLNVAIHGLRKALRNGYLDFSHIIYQDDTYSLNPEIQIWLDVSVFSAQLQRGDRLFQSGKKERAMRDYKAAADLYKGEFLAEDRYEEWVMPIRRRLQDNYLRLLRRLSNSYMKQQRYRTAIQYLQKIVSLEPLNEEAHRHLMQSYCYQGRYHLALRQFYYCEEKLQDEINMDPSPETAHLFARIRQHRCA